MRSIRLSLIVYFLVLLAVALGGVSWFFYQATARTLRGKEASTRELIKTQYDLQCQDLKTALDHRIQHQAWTMARVARHNSGHYEMFYSLGMLTAPLQGQGYLNASSWIASGFNPRLSQYLYRMRSNEIVIENADDMVPNHNPEQNQAQEYFQTYNKRGRTFQRSESMGNRSLTLDENLRERADLFVEHYDNIEPEPGWKLRRVTLKASVPRIRPAGWQPWRFNIPGPKGTGPKGTAGKGASQGPPPNNGPPGLDSTFLFIQYVSDTSLMEQKLAQFLNDRDVKFDQLADETRETLSSLRWRLLWIGLGTFAGIVAGGLILVGLGLAPLARLSEAVSQVSEKDFRLKIAPEDLPSELQPIAERLTDTLQQLQRAFAREKQAAADISHELRTPLAAMMTTLELALRKSRSPAEYRDLLEDIRASGSHMTHLVERLLALARLDAGAVGVRQADIDARDIAQQCTNLIRPLAEARGLALRMHVDGPVPIKSDPDKLREILNNLLHNAVEYNRPHGEIDLDVCRTNGSLRLQVSDTGIGITAEARKNIFERFYRADPSRHADTPHAGLGLAIVKSYVDLMGGSIEVDSNAKGSTFTIVLPVEGSPSVPRSAPAGKATAV
jgi:heavy metal sensor kinase